MASMMFVVFHLINYILPAFFLLCLFVFRWIFYGKFKHAAWAKKKRMAAITLITITVILAPFCFGGYYSLVAVEDGGLYEEGSASFTLGPGDTYRSERLSNRYAMVALVVALTTYTNPVTVYLCDEDAPTTQYQAANHTWSTEIYFILPYLYSGPFSIAYWTLNFYNPSPNATAGVSFGITGWQIICDPPPPDLCSALFRFQAPFIGLFLLWIAAGIVTAVARRDMRRKPRQETAEVQTEVRNNSQPETSPDSSGKQ